MATRAPRHKVKLFVKIYLCALVSWWRKSFSMKCKECKIKFQPECQTIKKIVYSPINSLTASQRAPKERINVEKSRAMYKKLITINT